MEVDKERKRTKKKQKGIKWKKIRKGREVELGRRQRKENEKEEGSRKKAGKGNEWKQRRKGRELRRSMNKVKEEAEKSRQIDKYQAKIDSVDRALT